MVSIENLLKDFAKGGKAADAALDFFYKQMASQIKRWYYARGVDQDTAEDLLQNRSG